MRYYLPRLQEEIVREDRKNRLKILLALIIVLPQDANKLSSRIPECFLGTSKQQENLTNTKDMERNLLEKD